MKTSFALLKSLFAFGLLAFVSHSLDAQNLGVNSKESPAKLYVNPFIGTGGHGHTFPGAVQPFGMVQLSPDTRNDASWDGCGGYHYDDSFIYGFTHTHLSGTGVSDWGDILVMPISAEMAKKFVFWNAYDLSKKAKTSPDNFYRVQDFVKGDLDFLKNKDGEFGLDPNAYRQPLKHDLEDAEAGYYTNYMANLRCKVRLTAGQRVGYHQYYFHRPEALSAGGNKVATAAWDGLDTVYFLIDLKHRDQVLQSDIFPFALKETLPTLDSTNTPMPLSVLGKSMSAGYKNRLLLGSRSSKAWADNQQLFFAMEFANNVVGYSYINEQQLLVAVEITKNRKVDLAVALSSTSNLSAWMNLQHELGATARIGDVYAEVNLAHFAELEKMRITLAKEMNSSVQMKTSTEKGKTENAIRESNNYRIFLLARDFIQSDLSGSYRPASWDFEQKIDQATHRWDEELSKISVKRPLLVDNQKASVTEQVDEKYTIFYTALYHAMIHPSLCSDVFGFYKGRDLEVHWADHEVYNVFSLWDTYRALHPLLTIIDAHRTNHFVKSFMLQYEQANRLPIWELSACETNCMIGYHSVSVIADAYIKGLLAWPNLDEKWLNAMVESARIDHSPSLLKNIAIDTTGLAGLVGNTKQMQLGYYGIEQRAESVSKILEYAYDDWCIARMAEQVAKNQRNATKAKLMEYNNIAQEFYTRSERWRAVYDAKTGFMRPRNNGGWLTPFEPKEVNNHYTEANGWQYSMYVPHDIMGLIDALGGEKAARNHLDSLFGTSSQTKGREQADITGLIGQYAHGNEPSHHMAYLYNYVGKPEKTQYLVNYICNEFYKNAPDGLIGNEDCGQMSAWYVMSAMGFYMVAPGSNLYLTGSPQFGEIQVARHGGVGYDGMSPWHKGKPETENLVIRVVQENASGLGSNSLANGGVKSPNYMGVVGDESVLGVQRGVRMEGNKNLIGAPVEDQWHLVVSHQDLMEWDAFLYRPVPLEKRESMFIRSTKQKMATNYAPGLLFEGEKVYKDSHLLTISSLSNWGGKVTLLLKGDGAKDAKFNQIPVMAVQSGVWSKFVFNASAEPIKIAHKGGLEVLGKIDSTLMVSDLPGSRTGGVVGNSDWTYGAFRPLPNDYDIVLSNKYQEQYTGGGNRALLDGIRGGLEWRAGGWQGYYDVPLVAKIDMHSVKKVSEVSVGFLQDSKAWIIFPKDVKVYFSMDGVNYKEENGWGSSTDAMDEVVQKLDVKFPFRKPVKARYIMVFAENYGALPKGHLGYPYNGKAHLFADEIQIKVKK